jgi:hypothetical protein
MIYRRQVANETSYNFKYQSLTTKQIRNNNDLKHLIISLVTKIRIRKGHSNSLSEKTSLIYLIEKYFNKSKYSIVPSFKRRKSKRV